MNNNSTPLIKFIDLQSFTTDVVADAFGIDSALNELLPLSEEIIEGPSDIMLATLLDRISHDTKVR